jgi:hypothetical protein
LNQPNNKSYKTKQEEEEKKEESSESIDSSFCIRCCLLLCGLPTKAVTQRGREGKWETVIW